MGGAARTMSDISITHIGGPTALIEIGLRPWATFVESITEERRPDASRRAAP
jgi:hypothetical protein